ncbi:MAG: hypothetical protein TU36_007965 [Vulcanisaeta sp. AZ3]
MPYYEDLPFNTYVSEQGIIKNLDALILPPGTLVESRVLERYEWLGKEIWEFIERGGLVIGVCSGAQLLSRAVNLNVKGLPGYVSGLGVLDIVFEPLIVTGSVRVRVVNESWATKGLLNSELSGWEAHTYGRAVIRDPSDVQVDGISITTRYNYRNLNIEVPTLISSWRYKVFGTMVHGILKQDSPIVRNIFNELGVNSELLIKEYYKEVQGRDWIIRGTNVPMPPKTIVVASTMTSEGKTLITTALAHCLSKNGYHVGITKLGGDIRDLHPSLYILKRPLRPWMSIKLRWGSQLLGLTDWHEVLNRATEAGLDYLIVEGVMGLLTGSSRDSTEEFSSTLGFVKRVNAHIILIASASYDGVEGALFRLRVYVNELARIGRKPIITILNNAYHDFHEDEELRKVKTELRREGIALLIIDRLPITSKPEELIDLGDYEEAAIKISESICEDVMHILDKEQTLLQNSH